MTSLEAFERLESAGFEKEKARAIVAAFNVQAENRLATKADLSDLQSSNTLLKWMVGFNLTLTAAILRRLL